MQTTQANVEYWFRLLYECLRGACYGSAGLSQFIAFLAHLWLWVVVIGYLLALIALFVIVYCMMRLFELRRREEEHYGTLILAPDAQAGGHPRWRHIEELVNGTTASEWRSAIMEADILLDELLMQRGYAGDGVGEKLKSVESEDLETLQDAWEAHKVRNQVAHQGSSFELTEELARRTVARYENVFREFRAI